MDQLQHAFDHTPESLGNLVEAWGLPRFRAKQVLEWIYQKHVTDPAAMTNLSKTDRATIAGQLMFLRGRQVSHQRASDGVQKLLLEWQDDAAALTVLGDTTRQTECVMIPTEHRRTACISSQIGCPVGCRFCASGLGGLDGNLTAGRMVEQVWQLAKLDGVGRISHVVFMGMGEPLANFDAVVKAVGMLNADWALGIAARRITISTVGLPAQIRRLADQHIQATLAISLHAPNDALRRELIPWAQYVTIEQLLDAGRYYFAATGREITLEYILLGQVNDQREHARQLAELARTLRANVNLIRYNQVADLPYRRPEDEAVLSFQKVLKAAGVNTHIRASRGRDIAAACGQLRHESSRTV